MTDKEIFKEIWSIKNLDVRAERMSKLFEQDEEVATRIKTLLRYSDRSQSVLENPLIFLGSPSVEQQTTRYSVTSELARGGMGVIYSAFDSQMRRDVVLKCLQLKHRNNFQAVQRFYNEAHITGQLQHPGIAPVYELGELEDGRPFYCMKLVEGKTLAQFLADRNSPLADKVQALNSFLQICQTMAFAHEHGILHRDLKPSNIIIGKHGQTQIMDWGVAKSLAATDETSSIACIKRTRVSVADGTPHVKSGDTESANLDLTRYGQIIGTPGYMSPEQALGQNKLIDKRSDVYSLGAILCEILTGIVPGGIEAPSTERGESALDDLNQRLLNSKVDLEMANLARSCLQQEPANRPQDANSVAQVMLAYFASREEAARATQIKLEKELTRNEETRKRRFLMATCVAACLGLLIAGIVGTSIGFYKENIARTLADVKAEDARIAKDLAIDARTAAVDSKAKAEARLEQLKTGNEILGSVFENLHPNQGSGKPLIDLLVENLDEAAEQFEGNTIGAPDMVASFQTKIGRCYRALGYEEKAIPLFEKAHNYAMTELGIENEITQDAKYRLAEALLSTRQAKHAKPLLEVLHEFYIREKKTDTPQFLKVQMKLSSVYVVAGEKMKALEIIEAHSERGLEIIGTEYAVQMAKVYYFNQMAEKAIKVLNLALSRAEGNSETNVGEIEKPDLGTENAKIYLARSYVHLNRPRKAIPILEELIPVFETRYGNSPSASFMIVTFSLGKALQGVGRYGDSIKSLQKSVDLIEAKSEGLQKNTVYRLYWLVEAYIKTGDFSKALQTATRIHNAQVATYGRGHEETSMSAEKLADIHLLINQPAKAKGYLDLLSTKHEFRQPDPEQRLLLGRLKFKLAMVTANQGELEVASEEFKTANELFGEKVDIKSNNYPGFFDNMEPQIWLAEMLALQGDKNAIQLIEEFESRIKKRSASLDEHIAAAQLLFRACVAKYIIKPDETLILRLKEVIEILKKEHLEGAQAHLLQEARSLLGITYLKLGKTADAKGLLESSFRSLQTIDNPLQQTNQATIDAGLRLSHFYAMTNDRDPVERLAASIKTIESNVDFIPSFSRSLIDKTLTTDSRGHDYP